MSKDLTKNLSKLNSSAKEYFQTKVDLIKVSLLEKSTKLTSILINLWIIVTLLIWIVGFGAAAFAVWYGAKFDNYPQGLLIAGGFLIVLALLFFLFRNSIITSKVLEYYSEIIFHENDENDE